MIAALVAVMATGAMASAFRAADTVYLPVAGKLTGANNSFFSTDVWLSNVSNSPATVWAAFAPQGADNAGAPAAAVRITPDLAANERREIVDFMGQVFGHTGTPATVGQVIFFAYREGVTAADCDPVTGNPNDCRQITVEARIYTTTAEGATFGQLIPGIPWYNFVSPLVTAGTNLDHVFITGIRQNLEYRTNIGLVNASQSDSAQIQVTLHGENDAVIGTFNENLPPLGFVQRNIADMFSGFTGTGAWVDIRQIDTGGNDLAFLAYGSLLDQRSNDPTYLEAQYEPGFDEEMIFCVYGAKPPRRLVKRTP